MKPSVDHLGTGAGAHLSPSNKDGVRLKELPTAVPARRPLDRDFCAIRFERESRGVASGRTDAAEDARMPAWRSVLFAGWRLVDPSFARRGAPRSHQSISGPSRSWLAASSTLPILQNLQSYFAARD